MIVSNPFSSAALTHKVRNLNLTFHWLPEGNRFWFKRQTPSGDELVVVNAESGEQSVVSSIDGSPAGEPSPRADEAPSPDGSRVITRRDDNLWLRDIATGAERALTTNGEPDFAYADPDPSYDRRLVARRRAGEPRPLLGVLWSPSARYVVALRQDLRPFPERLFVTEYVPPDGGYVRPHFRRFFTAEDATAPASELVLFDLETASQRVIALDPQALNDMALHFYIEGIVWWTATKLFLITANRGGTRFGLCAVDLATGHVTELLREEARFNVRLNPHDFARPNVYVSSSGEEIVWYSERTGCGHLYLHDAHTGKTVRQLTHGEWVVFDLLHVDEVQRLAYFTAASRHAGSNPYYRYLYRVALDSGSEPTLLTPETADHEFGNRFFLGAHRFAGNGLVEPRSGATLAPNGRYFIDCYSTTQRPPEYVLRRTSGELISRLLTSDASELYASGWRPPERVVAKAADGATDLYGVITLPRHFDPQRKYAVIDVTYPGPLGSVAPRSFADQLAGSLDHLHTFADAGFVVVALDGRGTAHRSREFRDAFLGTEDVFGAADHVAAIRNLASTRPYMDVDRVGIRGRSFGGYGALRAMLLFPEFFKVGVCSTGPAGYLDAEGQTNVERFFGVPGESVEARAHYESISNTRLVSRFAGRVLLVYGGVDESVPLKHAFAMFDAFIKADKDADMLVVPDSAHAVAREPYVIRRSVQYFVDHLGAPSQAHPSAHSHSRLGAPSQAHFGASSQPPGD